MASTKYKYRFYIDDVRVYPVFPASASLRYDRDDKRVFLRLKLSGVFTLEHGKRSDFYVVWAKTLDHQFTFRAEYIVDGVIDETINGTFYKTDCRFDVDNKKCEIQVNTIDKYDALLRGIDKEFQLVTELEPPTYSVAYKKQPLIQIAFPYHSVLYNRVGDTSWVTDIGTFYTSTELEGFGFYHSDDVQVYIPGNGSLSPDVSGLYTQTAATQYTRTDGVYRIDRAETTRWRIVEISSGDVKYRGPDGDSTILDKSPFTLIETLQLANVETPGNPDCGIFPVWMHQRILTDSDEIDSTPTIAVPNDDITGVDYNYLYYVDMSAYLGFAMPMSYHVSDNHTVAPNQYGRFAEDALHFAGEYFVPTTYPAPTTVGFPLFQNDWQQYSMTVAVTFGFQAIIDECVTDVILRDAYKLHEVIQYLLAQIDNTLVFNPTVFYSEFLFSSTNPITNEAQAITHFITPKSNILNQGYDHPATKAPIRFSDIEDLLMYGLNCFWWIDNNSNFRIEHLHYFKNGRSYASPGIGYDLTTQIEPRTGKSWAYHTNNYGYRKETLPEEFVHKWMDTTSQYFDGYPIRIRSGFVEKGNIETRQIGVFTSDINMGMVSPESLSLDGFFILAAEDVAGVWTVPFLGITIVFANEINLQNGYWSFFHLHDKFFRHYLPAEDVTINQNDIAATTTKRAREQDVVFPAGVHPDPMRLVVTAVGTGEISQMEINLTTRKATIKALHDLDFDNPCPTC